MLVGIFGLGAVNTFTQESKKKETTQAKTIRVETENKVLNEQTKRLNTQIKNLDALSKRLDAQTKKLEEKIKKLESRMDSVEADVYRIDYHWQKNGSCSSFCTGD